MPPGLVLARGGAVHAVNSSSHPNSDAFVSKITAPRPTVGSLLVYIIASRGLDYPDLSEVGFDLIYQVTGGNGSLISFWTKIATAEDISGAQYDLSMNVGPPLNEHGGGGGPNGYAVHGWWHSVEQAGGSISTTPLPDWASPGLVLDVVMGNRGRHSGKLLGAGRIPINVSITNQDTGDAVTYGYNQTSTGHEYPSNDLNEKTGTYVTAVVWNTGGVAKEAGVNRTPDFYITHDDNPEGTVFDELWGGGLLLSPPAPSGAEGIGIPPSCPVRWTGGATLPPATEEEDPENEGEFITVPSESISSFTLSGLTVLSRVAVGLHVIGRWPDADDSLYVELMPPGGTQWFDQFWEPGHSAIVWDGSSFDDGLGLSASNLAWFEDSEWPDFHDLDQPWHTSFPSVGPYAGNWRTKGHPWDGLGKLQGPAPNPWTGSWNGLWKMRFTNWSAGEITVAHAELRICSGIVAGPGIGGIRRRGRIVGRTMPET